jgi:hypothetical protein
LPELLGEGGHEQAARSAIDFIISDEVDIPDNVDDTTCDDQVVEVPLVVQCP